ncbi:hypothetical protein B7P43_G12157 [Cryptotermes secundus]|uniref:Reverse transcriptase/retrotransposon-derived protein RNase H-like domain-containing protein n=1 Tax=Cryptotermes secundus TaxID=105785 RepID=A0A2J7QM96_9NEOP|nr:hypothetical protein B7P43_G12157 [Cryptotermes secundus]
MRLCEFRQDDNFFRARFELSLLPNSLVGQGPEGYGLLYPIWVVRIHEVAHGDQCRVPDALASGRYLIWRHQDEVCLQLYGRFIKGFSQLAEPLHTLKRKNAQFVWGEPQRSAFQQLKEALATPPVLQIPDFSSEFSLVCDASEIAISAVLQQGSGESLAPIAYSSRLLSPAEADTVFMRNSQVERFNRNLKVALAIYHHAQHTHRDDHLESLALAFNSAWHESTAATPASLFLGRDLNHPLGLRWELAELDLGKDARGLQQFWESALSNLKRARARVAERYNKGRRQAEFRVGDIVLLRLHPLSSRSQQRSAKLDLKWSVPLRIARFVSAVTVLLANPDTGVIIRRAHVS